MLKKIYPYRFELFFFTQISILFGSLLFPSELFESTISPLLFIINLIAGIVLLSMRKSVLYFLFILLAIVGIIFIAHLFDNKNETIYNYIKMGSLFLFFIIVTYEIINQVWKTTFVDKTTIYGLVSGYISLGLIGFFICLSIELSNPNSFIGIAENLTITEGLMYYSYVTLLTIGYGDILPVTHLAQNAAILIGMTGQFYLVIVTAIVVGKYINQNKNNLKD